VLDKALEYYRIGDFAKAKKLLEELFAKDSVNIEVLHNLANVCRLLKDYEQAATYFQKTLELVPDCAEVLNNYGLLFYQQNQFVKAQNLFVKALKIKSDYFDAMYNLALALKAQYKIEEATACLLAIIKIIPDHVRANFLLGKLLLEEKVFNDANKYFRKIVAANADGVTILIEIVKCWLDHDRYQEAKFYCEKLLIIDPRNIAMLYNLAVIESRLSHKEQAVNLYQNILQIDSTYFPALNNLAVLYLEQQNIKAAQHYFQLALKQEPYNESISYTLNAIAGKVTLDKAPQEYIKNLFDGYADHFDVHLQQGLDYRVPAELWKMVGENKLSSRKTHSVYPGSRPTDGKMLDLGCGTGLCGERFRSMASYLVGVDLSPKMIAIAKKKNCYDELIVVDNVAYMNEHTAAFDLIVAADVFVYQGDLKPLFTACYKTLQENGLFAFSTEISQQQNFIMQPTGRFAHSKSYIEALAKEIGFKVLQAKTSQTRIQGNEPLIGYYFVLQQHKT
jgi:predicted TPR repeat methyltransferase/TolA-binding protein